MNHWLYIGTTDYLEHQGKNNLLLGFTINLLCLERPPYEVIKPEEAEKLVMPKVSSYQVWSFKLVDASDLKSKNGSRLKAVAEETAKSIQNALKPALADLVLQPPHIEEKDNELKQNTLSSMVAGMSQKGYPTAHALNLAAWIMVEAEVKDEETLLVVVPVLEEYLPPQDVRASTESEEVTCQYQSKANPLFVINAKIKATKIRSPTDDVPSPTKIPDFIGQSMDLDASEMLNWRAAFDNRAGEFLDLFHIRSRFGSWSEIDREDQMCDEALLERTDRMVAAFALAHDFLDNGLRPPLSAYPAGEKVLKSPYPGSLAWEIARALIESEGNDPTEEVLNQKIDAMIGKADSVPLGWPRKDSEFNWLSMLRDVLIELEGGNLGSYPNLKYALLDLAPTKNSDEIARPPWLVSGAVKEISLLLQDEEVLKRLFILQWKRPWSEPWGKDPNKMRTVIDEWCKEQNQSFSKCYRDGLAAQLLMQFDSKELEDQKSEMENAQFLLRTLLNKYHDAVSQKFSDLVALPEVLPDKKHIERMINEGYTEPGSENKETAWHERLMSKDRSSKPIGAPSAILVPSPVIGTDSNHFDPDHFSGVLLFCCRRDPDTRWCLVTVGDLALPTNRDSNSQAAAPAAASPHFQTNPDWTYLDDVAATLPTWQLPGKECHLVPAPQALGESLLFQLPGSSLMMEFEGNPIGVRLWEEFRKWQAKNTNATVYETDVIGVKKKVQPLEMEGVPNILHRQILSEEDNYEGHGPVPGLRYAKDISYEFLFCPVHNSGALPRLLRKDPNHPGLLASAVEIDRRIREQLAKQKPPPPTIKVNRYLRRVPVGAPRLLECEKDKDTYTTKLLPSPPAQVMPIASDIRVVYESDYMDDVGRENQADTIKPQPPSDIESPPPAPTVVLLHEDATELRFEIAPPATDVANWAIWVDTVRSDDDNVPDFVADVKRMIREKHWALEEKDNARELKEQIAALIDDPAVEGLYIRSRVLFSQGMQAPAETEYFKVAFLTCDHEIPPSDPDPGLHLSIDDEANLCRHLRTRFKDANGKQTLVICHGDFDPTLTQDDAAAVKVPAMNVWELEIIPCIQKSEWDQHFGLYAEQKALLDINVCPPSQKLATFNEKNQEWVAAMSGVSRLWIEAAPRRPPAEPDPTREHYLPSPEEVWHALRLGAVGTFTQRQPKVERLEVVLQPGMPKKEVPFSWTLVSAVEARWQRWYWRGMPEGLSTAWETAPILPQFPSDGKPVDLVGEHIEILRQLEAPSWAERRPGDVEKAETTADLSAWWLSREPKQKPLPAPQIPAPPPPATQINPPETGEPLDRPEHILARLRVWSRYRGLPGHEEPVEGVVLVTGVTAPNQEYHRRLTLRGKLKHPRPHVPRVKMVLPLFGAPMLPDFGLPEEEKHKQAAAVAERPGFLVILRESLASPFHHLMANVEWSKLEDVDSEGRPRVRTLPELAPDPITSPHSFDWNFRDSATLMKQSRQEGFACGLTYEREADSPLFPNAAFMFKAPADLAYPKELTDEEPEGWRHDWFVKVRFHWEISPARVMLDDPEYLIGEQSGAWQLRLLAPAAAPQMWRMANVKETAQVPVGAKVKVRVSIEGATLFNAFVGGQERGLLPNIPATAIEGMDEEDPVYAYLLAVWSLVPDVLNPEPSKAAHSLHLYLPQENTDGNPRRIPIYMAEGSLPAHGANLLRIFTRVKNLKMLADKLMAGKGSELEELMKWLFPDAKTNIEEPFRNWQDAGGIIDRCTEALVCNAA